MEVLNSIKTQLGNTIELIGNKSKNNILIVGVVHGDEPQGKYLIDKYIEKSTCNILSSTNNGHKENTKKNFLFIPCLNPDGMQENKRTNANNDETSNYFGGKYPASEIETQFLIDTIEKYKPNLIITLHAPYKVVNYDGPAQEIAKIISDIIKYPVEENIGYPTPGSFGTWAGIEKNIPTITLELDEKIPVTELLQPVHKIFDILKI